MPEILNLHASEHEALKTGFERFRHTSAHFLTGEALELVS
jgi:hypothetical protein